jgi:hypothetical protein
LNSNIYSTLPPTGTFAVRLIDGDPLIGNKLERMLAYQVAKQGYKNTDTNPDLLVAYAFSVSPAGAISSAYTAITNAPKTAYIYGNTVTVNASSSVARTRVDTTTLYQKTIVVRIANAKTGDKLWEANVSETGWCNQIFVTSPEMLSLMFQGFRLEQTNITRIVTEHDAGAKELMGLFPANTGWGCNAT